MGKDLYKKTRGRWWYGWVKYTYYDIWTESQREGKRITDFEWATAAQALRAAEVLAGALAAPPPQYKWRGRPLGAKNKKSPFTIIEVGVSISE